MKNVIYSLSVIFLLSSCSKDDSSGPKKSQDQLLQEASSVTDYSNKIQMNSFTVINANMTDVEIKEKYKIGCKTEGQSSGSVDEIDRSMQVGQVFRKQFAGSRILDSDTATTKEETVTMIRAGQINYDENFTELLLPGTPFTNVNQIFSSQPHIQSEMTYTIQPNGGHQSEEKSVAYNFTPAARDFFSNRLSTNNDNINCHVEYKNGNYNPIHSTDKVYYNLNGRNVVGYMDKQSESGNIVCVKYGKDANLNVETSMGPGVSEYTEITSNDVVSQGFIYCGGSSIYRNSKVFLNSGKVLQTYVEKTLYAPER